jgi:hypothetical protein
VDVLADLSWQGELVIVVIGSLVTVVIVGVLTALWRWWCRPELEFTTGAGPEFDKHLGEADPFVAMVVGSKDFVGARAKVICVRETRGKRPAENVAALISEVRPEPRDYPDAALRWAGNEARVTIEPKGRAYLRLQTAIVSWRSEAEKKGTLWCNATPTLVEHPGSVDFRVTLTVNGRRGPSARFRMENAWTSERVFAAFDERTRQLTELEFPRVSRIIC